MSVNENAPRAAAALGGRRHEGFLGYSHYRYMGLSALLSALSVVVYIADRPYGTRYGGTWAGYALGISGALLILWLTWYGYRKRNYVAKAGKLSAYLSAHVYLGLLLLVLVTLHTGFHFGWNVHTLAYALMCIVIASGVFGVVCYTRYPRLMTENRAGMTIQQMLGTIATIDEKLRDRGMPLDDASAIAIERAIETTAIGGSVWRQLTGRYPNCATAAAVEHFSRRADSVPVELEETWSQLRLLLNERASFLRVVRRDIRYKAFLDIWLYVHVPVSFMLIGALVSHIVSIFFFF